MYDISIF